VFFRNSHSIFSLSNVGTTPSDEDFSPYSIVEPTDYFRSSGNTNKVNPPFVIEFPSKKEPARSEENVN